MVYNLDPNEEIVLKSYLEKLNKSISDFENESNEERLNLQMVINMFYF